MHILVNVYKKRLALPAPKCTWHACWKITGVALRLDSNRDSSRVAWHSWCSRASIGASSCSPARARNYPVILLTYATGSRSVLSPAVQLHAQVRFTMAKRRVIDNHATNSVSFVSLHILNNCGRRDLAVVCSTFIPC